MNLVFCCNMQVVGSELGVNRNLCCREPKIQSGVGESFFSSHYTSEDGAYFIITHWNHIRLLTVVPPPLLQVFDCLQHRELNVTVLSDSSVAEYKTADYLSCVSAPFLRSLHSGAFSGRSVCQSLEQPNIVTGLPAAGTAVARLRRRVLNRFFAHYLSSYNLHTICGVFDSSSSITLRFDCTGHLSVKLNVSLSVASQRERFWMSIDPVWFCLFAQTVFDTVRELQYVVKWLFCFFFQKET